MKILNIEFSRESNLQPVALTPCATTSLTCDSWPGNEAKRTALQYAIEKLYFVVSFVNMLFLYSHCSLYSIFVCISITWMVEIIKTIKNRSNTLTLLSQRLLFKAIYDSIHVVYTN